MTNALNQVVGRIEFEDGTFRQNDKKFYMYISEERIREIVREELTARGFR